MEMRGDRPAVRLQPIIPSQTWTNICTMTRLSVERHISLYTKLSWASSSPLAHMAGRYIATLSTYSYKRAVEYTGLFSSFGKSQVPSEFSQLGGFQEPDIQSDRPVSGRSINILL